MKGLCVALKVFLEVDIAVLEPWKFLHSSDNTKAASRVVLHRASLERIRFLMKSCQQRDQPLCSYQRDKCCSRQA